jgi:hypothetical protein
MQEIELKFKEDEVLDANDIVACNFQHSLKDKLVQSKAKRKLFNRKCREKKRLLKQG